MQNSICDRATALPATELDFHPKRRVYGGARGGDRTTALIGRSIGSNQSGEESRKTVIDPYVFWECHQTTVFLTLRPPVSPSCLEQAQGAHINVAERLHR